MLPLPWAAIDEVNDLPGRTSGAGH